MSSDINKMLTKYINIIQFEFFDKISILSLNRYFKLVFIFIPNNTV